jgi:hypothetical protein
MHVPLGQQQTRIELPQAAARSALADENCFDRWPMRELRPNSSNSRSRVSLFVMLLICEALR